MSTLVTDSNLADPDELYESLVALHRDLTTEQSRLANAKLILLLANHIGDRAVIEAAIAKARDGFGPSISDGERTKNGRPRLAEE